MTTQKEQQLRDDYYKYHQEQRVKNLKEQGYDVIPPQVADYWLARMKEQEEELVKAFGGCTKCYGKGYFTNLDHATGKGIDVQTPYYNPCTCDRGLQIESLLGKE